MRLGRRRLHVVPGRGGGIHAEPRRARPRARVDVHVREAAAEAFDQVRAVLREAQPVDHDGSGLADGFQDTVEQPGLALLLVQAPAIGLPRLPVRLDAVGAYGGVHGLAEADVGEAAALQAPGGRGLPRADPPA